MTAAPANSSVSLAALEHALSRAVNTALKTTLPPVTSQARCVGQLLILQDRDEPSPAVVVGKLAQPTADQIKEIEALLTTAAKAVYSKRHGWSLPAMAEAIFQVADQYASTEGEKDAAAAELQDLAASLMQPLGVGSSTSATEAEKDAAAAELQDLAASLMQPLGVGSSTSATEAEKDAAAAELQDLATSLMQPALGVP